MGIVPELTDHAQPSFLGELHIMPAVAVQSWVSDAGP
jgi:hypothetical protein